MPRLREADWQGREVCCCRPLAPTLPIPIMPVVAFGYDLPNSVEYVPRAALGKLGLTESELEQLAIENLCKRPATWKRIRLGNLNGLVMEADFFNAERILNQKCMIEAQDLLHAPLLWVGIPHQGMLFVTNAAPQQADLSAFVQLVYIRYKQSTAPSITPSVFWMKDGQITGQLDLENANLPDVPTPMDDVEVKRIVARPPGEVGYGVVLSVVGSDPSGVSSVVWSHLVAVINATRLDEDFCGILRVILSPEKMPDTTDQQQVIETLLGRFNGYMSDHPLTTTIGGRPLSLQVTVLQ